MLSILIVLLLAHANGFVVPASCWWIFGVLVVTKLVCATCKAIKENKP